MNNRKRNRRKPCLGVLITAFLIALLLYAYVTQHSANRALEGELIGVRKALSGTRYKQIELDAKLSAVQAAVVETNVKLAKASVKKAEAKPVGKPVVKTKETTAPETTYVDPVSTFLVGGVLSIGKHVITNGGRIFGIQ